MEDTSLPSLTPRELERIKVEQSVVRLKGGQYAYTRPGPVSRARHAEKATNTGWFSSTKSSKFSNASSSKASTIRSNSRHRRRDSHAPASEGGSRRIVDPPQDTRETPVSQGPPSMGGSEGRSTQAAEPSEPLTSLQAIKAHKKGTLTEEERNGMVSEEQAVFDAWRKKREATARKKEAREAKKAPDTGDTPTTQEEASTR